MHTLVTVRSHFCAAHRLYRSDWSQARNHEIFGECANLNGHGHNYDLEVTVEGPVDPATGMVLDMKALKAILQREVTGPMDHKNLNLDVAFLEGVIPTAENIAVAIWRILEPRIPEGRLVSIKLFESGNNYVEYRGE